MQIIYFYDTQVHLGKINNLQLEPRWGTKILIYNNTNVRPYLHSHYTGAISIR